jgi:hypothetical protein
MELDGTVIWVMHSNHFSVVKQAVCWHCAGIVPAPRRHLPATFAGGHDQASFTAFCHLRVALLIYFCAGIKPTTFIDCCRVSPIILERFLHAISISGSCQHSDSSSRKICFSVLVRWSDRTGEGQELYSSTRLLAAGAHRGGNPCVHHYLLRQRMILHFEG